MSLLGSVFGPRTPSVPPPGSSPNAQPAWDSPFGSSTQNEPQLSRSASMNALGHGGGSHNAFGNSFGGNHFGASTYGGGGLQASTSFAGGLSSAGGHWNGSPQGGGGQGVYGGSLGGHGGFGGLSSSQNMHFASSQHQSRDQNTPLPGFLSAGGAPGGWRDSRPNGPSPPAHRTRFEDTSSVQQDTLTPSRSGKFSPNRFGYDSLFAPRESDRKGSLTDKNGPGGGDDAPPTLTLSELEHEENRSAAAGTSQASQALAGPSNPTAAPSQNAPPPIYKVHMFGFPPRYVPRLERFLRELGNIVKIEDPSLPVSEGGLGITGANWITVEFEDLESARRALAKNGEILDKCLMIGVRWAEGYGDGLAAPAERASKPALGQPYVLRSADQAFRQPVSKPKTTVTAQPTTVPLANLFQNREAALAGKGGNGQQSSGVWGKVSDLVFGW